MKGVHREQERRGQINDMMMDDRAYHFLSKAYHFLSKSERVRERPKRQIYIFIILQLDLTEFPFLCLASKIEKLNFIVH